MIWHDMRLAGIAPPIAPNIYAVDGTTDLDYAIEWIATFARSLGGLDELMIMCPRLEANWELRRQMSSTTTVGGFGLLICKQGISRWNVGKVRAWNAKPGRPLIRRVTIYACSAADTGPGNQGTWRDARRFMGEFAIHSGASVVAARNPHTFHPASVKPVNPLPIDFGAWRGPVFLFDSATGIGPPFRPGSVT
jgi:hypothetical protein